MSNSFPDPFVGSNYWELRSPDPISPVPATMIAGLRGRRVLIGLPGYGWRGDLRADEKVIQGSRTYIPVMPESEWYRAESEQTEVFAALIPIDRVWVEDLGVAATLDTVTPDRPQLVSLDQPPRRLPQRATLARSLAGQRIVRLLTDGDEQRDLRATTELYTSENGEICARIAVEVEWYRWSWSGRTPPTLETSADFLWVE
jgi:hypothetical protein